MTLDDTSPSVKDFKKDALERAGKTALQGLVGSLLIALGDIENWLGDVNEPVLVTAAPVFLAGLSWVTSWLSRYKGDPNSASLNS